MKKTITEISIGVILVLTTLLLWNFFFRDIPKPTTAITHISTPPPPPPADKLKVQVALLLDTSSSMDGLIEQTKSQLWGIVSELALAEQEGKEASIEIAVYEYGNDNLSASNGYVRQVLPLTTDLDLVSQQLFALTTNGGEEYCGKVILDATSELKWSEADGDLRMIFIAGNEPFDQGSWDYRTSCQLAVNKDITISTIFCGESYYGSTTAWSDGALIAGGTFTAIDHNQTTVYVSSPYDQEIADLNQQLNSTYMYYDQAGNTKFEMMKEADEAAQTYSIENTVSRASCKSKSTYDNSSWDLISGFSSGKVDLETVDTENLPSEYRGLESEELEMVIEEKLEDRKAVQDKINELSSRRKDFVEEAKLKEGISNEFQESMMGTIQQKAATKNIEFKK